MAQLTDDLIEKIWNALFEKQRIINKQMDESEKKYYQRLEENKRILEENERKFFDLLDDKKRHLDETEEQFAKRMEANRIFFENLREKEKQKAAERRLRTRRFKYNIEAADHPVYFAIIRFFSERGYQFDEETMKLYWELITSVTHLASAAGLPEHPGSEDSPQGLGGVSG